MTTDAPPPPAAEAGGGGAPDGPGLEGPDAQAPAPEAEPKRGRGRPTKLTPDRAKKFYAAIRRGHPPDSAACVAGFGRSTFREWLAQGEKDRADGLETELTDFLDGTERANALFFDKHLRRIDKASAGKVAGGTNGARLSLALLGRRAPEYFADRRAVELTGKGGGPVQVEHRDPRQMTEAEIEAELAAAAGARP